MTTLGEPTYPLNSLHGGNEPTSDPGFCVGSPRLIDCLANTTPWAKQEEAFQVCTAASTFALFMEQRTGKTLVTIGRIVHLHRQGLIDAALIVAMPSGVPRNWLDELQARAPADIPRMDYAWQSGKVKTKAGQETLKLLLAFKGLAILAINGEAILTEAFRKYAAKFLRQRRTLLVGDETSLIMASPAAKRTRVMHNMAPLAPYRLILDGTPYTESPLSLYSQVGFLDKQILGHASYASFKNHYAEWEEGYDPRSGRRYPRMKRREDGTPAFVNMDELAERLRPISFTCKRTDCFDIPPKLYTPYRFQLTTTQRKVYDALQTEFEATLTTGHKVTAAHVLARYTRLQQITSNFWPPEALLAICESCEGDGCTHCDGLGAHASKTAPRTIDPSTNPRLDALQDVLSTNHESGIVWARFRRDIDAIMTAAPTWGRHPTRYDGLIPPDARAFNKDDFQKGRADLFVAQQAAAQRGLDLSAAQFHIYYSNTYSGLVRQQTEDRTEVANRPRGTGIIDLIAEDTVDEDIVAAHLAKRRMSDIIEAKLRGTA